MGTQYSVQRSGLEMGETTPNIQKVLPAKYPSPRRLRTTDAPERSHRAMSVFEVPGKIIQCAEEGFVRTENDPRPIPSQQVHRLSQVQDDHCLTGQDTPTPWLLHQFYRSERCVLACSGIKNVSSFPRIRLGPESIQIQGYAFRPQYSPSNIYKTDGNHSIQTSVDGVESGGLPRRLANWAQSNKQCQEATMKAIEVIHEMGVYSKLEEVQTSSSEGIRVVGLEVGSHKTHPPDSHFEAEVSGIPGKIYPESQESVQKKCRKGPRLSTIHFDSRSYSEEQTQRSQSSLALESKLSKEGCEKETSKGAEIDPQALVSSEGIQNVSPSSSPSSLRYHPYGCVPVGLGGPHRDQKGPRQMVPLAQSSSYKLSGASGSNPVTEVSQSTVRESHPSSYGQHDGSMRSEKGGGSQSPMVNGIIRTIVRKSQLRNWHISVSHLQGVRNVIADSLSRDSPQETEWSLDMTSFQEITSVVPDLQVDLFATSFNNKLPLYVAPNLDPLAVAVDSLNLDWNQWQKIYLFPPFNTLLKVLEKLRSFQGTAVLVAPRWVNSSWFPLLKELKATEKCFSSPKLYQEVQGRTISADSSLTTHLRMWIFLPSFTADATALMSSPIC